MIKENASPINSLYNKSEILNEFNEEFPDYDDFENFDEFLKKFKNRPRSEINNYQNQEEFEKNIFIKKSKEIPNKIHKKSKTNYDFLEELSENNKNKLSSKMKKISLDDSSI